MARSKKVDLRLRDDEYEKVKQDTQSKGYDSVNAYLRALLSGRDSIFNVNDITKKLIQELMEKK